MNGDAHEPPALRARDLVVERRSRGNRFELRVPLLELRSHEPTAILGPNGAGKTTLLLALAGLIEPRAGRIEVHAPGPVTMVFQRPVAFDGSVAHNVRVALLGQRLAPGESRRRVEEALGRFAIAGLARRRASQLSGGELRRVALARAFAMDPSVLLLDEPFEDLDFPAQESLARDLARASRETGTALALVTHDLRRAATLADQIAVVDAGAIVQQGRAQQVMQAPANARIARLIGMTNLIPAVVSSAGSVEGSVVLEVDSDHRLEARSDLPIGARVWVGVRGERVKLGAAHDDVVVVRRRGRAGEDDDEVHFGESLVRDVGSDSVLTTLRLLWAGHELCTYAVSGRGLASQLAVGDRVEIVARRQDLHVMRRE